MTGTFSLGEEHNDFRAAVADFAARDLAPHVERWNAAHEAPLEAIKLMADLGLFGLGGPEEYGGRWGLHQPVHRDRGDRQGGPVTRDHPRGCRGAGHQPDRPLRYSGAEGALAAGSAGRAGAGCLRADRTRSRLGCWCYPDARHAA